jgi:hypothetical protein
MQGHKVYGYELSWIQREAIKIFRDYNDFQIYPWPKDAAREDMPVTEKEMLRFMMDLFNRVKRTETQRARDYAEERRDAHRRGGISR